MAIPVVHKNNLNSNFKFDNTNKKVYTNFIPKVTLAELRAFTAINISHNPVVYIIDDGKNGSFVYDSTDTTSVDDNAIVIKTTTGNFVYKRKYKGAIYAKWFGAKGDGVTDDTIALQTAFNYSRNNKIDVHLSSQANYLITNKLVNQIDGNWKPLRLEGNNATLLCNTNGKTALELTGGYAMNHISNLNLLYSGTITTADTLTHGIVINSTRVNFKNVKVDGFCGDGFRFVSSVPNMNSSIWSNIRSDNNKGYGFHISGTDDNISVIKAELYCENNGKSGVFVTTDSTLRDCDLFIYAENNCQLDLTKANVYFGKIQNSYLTIYSEQVNSAEEIRLTTNCTDNLLLSFRNNKDYFSGSNTGIRGNKIYQQDTSRASTPLILRGDYAREGIDGEYVRLIMQGILGDYGDLRGENDGIYVHRNGHKIGTTQDNIVAKSNAPFLIQTALKLYGDISSVAAYINGDLAFRQQNGTNIYLDLSSNSSTKGDLIVRNSNTYEKVFQIKNNDAIFIKPTSSKTTTDTVEGDIWYDNTDDKIKYRRQNDIGVLMTEKTSFNVQTGTNYQLDYFDLYKVLVRNSSTAGTTTIPNDVTLNYPIGSVIDVENTGDGEMLIDGLSGVVINNSLESSPIIRSRGKVKLVKTAANTWSLNGDLKPKRFKVASNFTNSTVTPQDISEFSFPVRAGNEYMIDVIIVFNTAIGTTGAKLGVYLPSGAGTVYGFLNGQITNSAANTDLTAAITNIGATNAALSFLLTTGTNIIPGVKHIMQGKLIFNCTTNGTLQFQWASEVDSSNAVLVAGSRIFVKEI